MKIVKARISNIRSIEHIVWEPAGTPGWNVILGDNGSGKTSFLRAIALALVGPEAVAGARQVWSSWLRSGQDRALSILAVHPDKQYDSFSGKGRVGEADVAVAVGIDRQDDEVVVHRIPIKDLKMDPKRHLWGTGSGWFSASYGPFRRFSGGDRDAERSFLANPRLGAHLSVFGENISLLESLEWLRELNYKRLENEAEGAILKSIKVFVNQDGFLPHNIKLKAVSSRGVEFEDIDGTEVGVEELSDGFRSILSMTFELIRQLSRQWSASEIFSPDNSRIMIPGVVLIDEIDAHLHPTWQKRIGFWLTNHFPEMQFVVTSHSPLICQAAESGSIFLLPRPGTGEPGRMLKGTEHDRLVYGDVIDAYSTEAFGLTDTRSDEGRKRLERLAVLNAKELRTGLSKFERAQQRYLRAMFPSSPHVMVGK